MLKLYQLDLPTKNYWETWEGEGGVHTVHWGVLGTTGESQEVKRTLFRKPTNVIQDEIDARIREGYRQVDADEHRVLLVEYAIDGFGTPEDLDKRHRLEARMNETIGWTGLGACDGGSIGSGTMEVCCFVVDFDLAAGVIESDLKDTEFGDYTRIYDEGA